MRKQSWSVGILCYNESHTIQTVTEEVIKTLSGIASEFEVIVVDDGSTDSSAEIIKKMARQNEKIIHLAHDKNKGMGAGFHSVYKTAKLENVMVVAGDGQFDVSEVLPFENIPIGSFVSFHRPQKPSYNLFRNKLSDFNRWVNKKVLGIDLKDVNWIKIFKNEDLKQLNLELGSSLLISEICAKLLYLNRVVIESESKYLPRKHEKAKGSFVKMLIQAALDTLTLIKVMRRFKRDLKRV